MYLLQNIQLFQGILAPPERFERGASWHIAHCNHLRDYNIGEGGVSQE